MEPDVEETQSEITTEQDFFKEHENLESSDNFYSAETKFGFEQSNKSTPAPKVREDNGTITSSVASNDSSGSVITGPNVTGVLSQSNSNLAQQSDRKPTIGVRKIQPKRSGVGVILRKYYFFET